MIFESNSTEDTKNFSKNLASKIKKGSIICLVGDLGVGKTAFSKGFAEGLGIDEDITSPTFSIVNVYDETSIPLYHFDVYRINNSYEMEDTGYEDYFYGDGICLIEWAENIKDLIPKEAIWITIEKNSEKGDNYRKIILSGDQY